jgi:uncharacterized protein (TIGR02145 family)
VDRGVGICINVFKTNSMALTIGNRIGKRILPIEENEDPQIKYGYLYNWYAVSDVRGIANSGWRVPTSSEFGYFDYLLEYVSVGGKLKEVGFVHWNEPNAGASNTINFNARGSGLREYTAGDFVLRKERAVFWTITKPVSMQPRLCSIFYNSTGIQISSLPEISGCSLRLIRDATPEEKLTKTDGDSCGQYIGNDLMVYDTLYIGNVDSNYAFVTLTRNLAETKYANGDIIPVVPGNNDWLDLTTGALCAYNNDLSLV